MLTTEELIGYRARALAKHRVHVADMRKHVSAEKQAHLAKYEKDHRNKIDDRFMGLEIWFWLEIQWSKVP